MLSKFFCKRSFLCLAPAPRGYTSKHSGGGGLLRVSPYLPVLYGFSFSDNCLGICYNDFELKTECLGGLFRVRINAKNVDIDYRHGAYGTCHAHHIY